MLEKTVAFHRRFQVWSYTVSHTQLLLRSTKTEEAPTRIDVLFKDAVSINIPMLIDDLRVDVLRESAVPDCINMGSHELSGRTIYSVRGVNCDGYVVAGYFGYVEDEGEYYEPSSLLQLPG